MFGIEEGRSGLRYDALKKGYGSYKDIEGGKWTGVGKATEAFAYFVLHLCRWCELDDNTPNVERVRVNIDALHIEVEEGIINSSGLSPIDKKRDEGFVDVDYNYTIKMSNKGDVGGKEVLTFVITSKQLADDEKRVITKVKPEKCPSERAEWYLLDLEEKLSVIQNEAFII